MSRERDKDYRKHMAGQPCWACGAQDGTVVGAHKRRGNLGGTGLKPSDEYLAALCHKCHLLEHSGGKEQAWVWDQVLNRCLRREYWKWRGDV
jgi:hypothetical protein